MAGVRVERLLRVMSPAWYLFHHTRSAAGGMRAPTVRSKSPVPVHSGASGLIVLVPPDGVEPPAVRLGGACSVRLSYEGNACAGRESNPRPSD